MAKTRYTHSAYWYAKNYGYTRSDKETFAERYIDYCTRPARGGGTYLYDFNPLILCAYAMIDAGLAVKRDIDTLRDPVERDRIRREAMRDLRSCSIPPRRIIASRDSFLAPHAPRSSSGVGAGAVVCRRPTLRRSAARRRRRSVSRA